MKFQIFPVAFLEAAHLSPRRTREIVGHHIQRFDSNTGRRVGTAA